MATAFVTGGTGFIGVNLVAELTRQGWTVTCLHRSGSNLKYLNRFPVSLRLGDLRDARSLEDAMPDAVDAVFHVAADTSSWAPLDAAQTATNVGGTRNLIVAARRRGARRIVFTSTASAYGQHAGVVSEDTPSSAPGSWINYERSKWRAEEELRGAAQSGLHVVIVNPCAVFGPYDTSVWGGVFRQIRAGRMKVLPPGSVPVNHVEDVARAHIAAALRGRSGENYILPGEVVAFAQLFREMARLMDIELRAPVAPAPLFKLLARVAALVARLAGREPDLTPEMAQILCGSNRVASDKAARELGYRPRRFIECLQDDYRWLESEGLL